MASQEFLASFAVEIDEAGVSRLQQVLADFERYSSSLKKDKYVSEAQNIYTKTRAALARMDEQGK